MWLPKIFNGFLILFGLDAALSAGLETCQALAGPYAKAFNFLQNAVATTTAISGFLVLVAICSYRGTPWKTLAVPLLFVFWASMAFLPLPAITSSEKLFRFAAYAQLLIAGCSLWATRVRFPRGRWVIPAEAFAGSAFSISRMIGATLIKLLVLCPILIIYLCACLVWSLGRMSHGFITISEDGLYTEKRIYDYQGKKIHLLPTVHIASPDFYGNLIKDLPRKDAVILPEGVTDRNKLIRDGLDYSGPADSVGLATQPSLVDLSNLTFRACDVDVSEFSQSTLRDLESISKCLKKWTDGDQSGCLQQLSILERPNLDSLKTDLLDNRNAKVNEALVEALKEFNHVGIPWGAAHMPGIEENVLKMGAKKLSSDRVRVFRWADLNFSF
jgi:hypothetical protein